LDTFTAYSVASLLKNIAVQHSRTIVATIHQPSSEIFHLFDDLVLLDQGRVIYAGPAQAAMEYFRTHLGFDMPKFTNPSDYIFMHILNAAAKAEGGQQQTAQDDKKHAGSDAHDAAERGLATRDDALAKKVGADAVALVEEAKVPEHEEENGMKQRRTQDAQGSPSQPQLLQPKARKLLSAPSSAGSALARQQRLATTWNGDGTSSHDQLTPERQQMDALLTTHSQPDSSFHLPTASDLHHTGATFWTQFACLCGRALNDVFRNPYKLRARIGQVLFVSIFAGLVYLQVGLGQSSIQNRSGVLFFLCAGGVMNSAMGTVAIFAGEKEVFVREFGARMYSLSSFFFSKLAMELPLRIIFPILSAAIVYWMVSARNRHAG
jgi:hypothetical protein